MVKTKDEPVVEEKKVTPVTTGESESSKEKLRRFIEEETVLVEGRFKHYETPGASHRVQVKKYKDVPMFDKWMTDNMVYKIPLYVARHLNGVDKTAGKIGGKINTCSHAIHEWKHGKNDPLPASELGCGPGGEPGIPVPILSSPKYKRRFGFESLEFDANS